MTTINSAAPSTPIQSGALPPTGLTAEGILAYCSTRLHSLDGLIQARFTDQKQKATAIKEAGKAIEALNTFGALTEKGENREADHRKLGANLCNLWMNTTDPQVKDKIADAYQKVMGLPLPVGSDNKIGGDYLDGSKPNPMDPSQIKAYTADAWQVYIGNVKELQNSFTKEGELSMIELQSFVSQRQQAVQLATQMMATMAESAKQVLGNIR